jgi:HEPN domain-containing protein
MNRGDFQRLTEVRLADAQLLLENGQYDGAYYVAGYAIECALKACIAKQTNQYDFPQLKTVRDSYTHDLSSLLRLAGLERELDLRAAGDLLFAQNWTFLKDWSEESRYASSTEANAASLFAAIADSEHGVLPWLRTHW